MFPKWPVSADPYGFVFIRKINLFQSKFYSSRPFLQHSFYSHLLLHIPDVPLHLYLLYLKDTMEKYLKS